MQNNLPTRPLKRSLIGTQDLTSSAGFRTMKLKQSGQSFYRPASRDRGCFETSCQLQILNLEQEEIEFASSLKFDLLNLQDQINKIDLDGKVIQEHFQIFQNFLPQNIQVVKQWLQKNQSGDIKKLIDQKVMKDISCEQIMQWLKTEDPRQIIKKQNQFIFSKGLVKLYKLISMLDIIVLKLTELECLHYIQYEQMKQEQYYELPQQLEMKNVKNQIKLLNLKGFSQIDFKFAQLISNVKEIFTNKLTKNNQIMLNNKKMKQIKFAINHNQPVFKQYFDNSVDQTYSLLAQSQLLNPNNDRNYYIKVIDEVKDGYNQLVAKLQNENSELKQKIGELSIKYEESRNQLQEQLKKNDNLKQIKDELYVRFQLKYKTNEEFEQSYESALRDEFNRMHSTYENRIKDLENENLVENWYQNIAFKYKKIELKTQFDKESEKTRVLTKKLSILQKQ